MVPKKVFLIVAISLIVNFGCNTESSNPVSADNDISAPILVLPLDNATSIPSTATLMWNRVPSASRYILQVATDQNFISKIINDSNITDTSKQIGSLSNNQKYYWRVAAVSSTISGVFSSQNTTNTSNWSTIRNFTITNLVVSVGENFCGVYANSGTEIFFISNRDGKNEIYKMKSDGTNHTRISNNDVQELNFDVSADYKYIVFETGDYNSAQIYIMNIDGTNLKKLTNNTRRNGYPSFSPDSKKIIFEATDNDSYLEIFTMVLNGDNRTQITNVPGSMHQFNPHYCFNGSKIVFCQSSNGDARLVLMNADGGNWIYLTGPNQYGYVDLKPMTDPSSTRACFATSHWTGNGGYLDIAAVNLTGAILVKLTNTTYGGEMNYFPCYSPDGLKILFTSNKDKTQQLYIMGGNDGSNVICLTK